MLYIGVTLLGVLLFAGGSCREAYIRGSLSVQPSIYEKVPRKQTRPAAATKPSKQLQTETKEQIKEYPIETEPQETFVYEQEQ